MCAFVCVCVCVCGSSKSSSSSMWAIFSEKNFCLLSGLFAIYKVSDILALLLSELQLVNKVGHIPPSKCMLCKPVSQSVGLRLLIPFESSHFALFSNNIH